MLSSSIFSTAYEQEAGGWDGLGMMLLVMGNFARGSRGGRARVQTTLSP